MVNMILEMDLEDPAIDETIRDWVKVRDTLVLKQKTETFNLHIPIPNICKY